MGEPCEVPPQLFLHIRWDVGNSKGGGVGNVPPVGERAEKDRVKPAVRENLWVPDLVAAGENHIIGQRRVPQLRKASKPVGRDAQMFLRELLKPLIPAAQSLVMQGGMNVGGGAAKTGGPAKKGIVLVDKIVNDLTGVAQGFHRPFRGRSLQGGSIVVDMIERDKSCVQANALPFFMSSDPSQVPGGATGHPPEPSQPQGPLQTPSLSCESRLSPILR